MSLYTRKEDVQVVIEKLTDLRDGCNPGAYEYHENGMIRAYNDALELLGDLQIVAIPSGKSEYQTHMTARYTAVREEAARHIEILESEIERAELNAEDDAYSSGKSVGLLIGLTALIKVIGADPEYGSVQQ